MPSPGDTLTLPRTRRLLAAGLGVGVLLAVAACGGDDPAAGPSPSASASASPSASDTASASASPSASTSASPTASASASATPSETPSGPATSQGPPDGSGSADLAAALLTAAEVPGLNAESPWRAGRTGAVGDGSFGWCSRFGALTAGATAGVQRGFTSPAARGDRAGQQVLDFVDETNARRAVEVYRGWHRDCRGRSGTDVGPIRSVPVASGTAWWYLSQRGERWEAFGLAMADNRVTVLRMEHAGQDHTYPPGEDPLEVALATAARKLG